MALSKYNESNKDEEQEETEINHLQKPVSRWEANVGIRRDQIQIAVAKTVTWLLRKITVLSATPLL